MGELKKVLAGEADVPDTGVIETVEGHPEARRNETAFEKLDRNWGDLLQELRVMQTGTQIVTAFLIILPFQSRFEELVDGLEGWYVALLISAVLRTVLMLMHVVAHRRYFGRQIKNQTVAWGNLFVKICLAGLALLLIGCVTFITHLVLPDVIGWIVAGATAVVIIAVMTLLPPRSSVPVQE